MGVRPDACPGLAEFGSSCCTLPAVLRLGCLALNFAVSLQLWALFCS